MNIKFDHIFSADSISAENIDIVGSIDLQYFPTPWKRSAWEDLFSNSSKMLTLARSSGTIVGFTLFDLNVVDSFAHLLKIIILPDIQNKGVGELLLRSCFNILTTDKKINQYFLEVEVGNQAAISLYNKCGLHIIHTKKDFYGTSKDAFIMTMNHGRSI